MKIKINPSDLRKLTIKELNGKKAELEKILMSCHRGVNPKMDYDNHTNIRKNIARINTIIKEKENTKDV